MNFIKKLLKKEQKDPKQWKYCYNPEKSYYDDFSESYFKNEHTGQVIRITAEDALDMVVFQDLGKAPKQIYQMGYKESLLDELGGWDNDITVEDVELWLDEFNKGHMDQAVKEICNKQIEGQNRDADRYLSMKKDFKYGSVDEQEIFEDNHDTGFINKEYLKQHYREMMYVDDVPFPTYPYNAFVPEIDDIMIERIENEGRDSLYGHYRDGYFHEEGEDFIEESFRLLRIYLKKHPEHLGLLNNPEVLDKE